MKASRFSIGLNWNVESRNDDKEFTTTTQNDRSRWTASGLRTHSIMANRITKEGNYLVVINLYLLISIYYCNIEHDHFLVITFLWLLLLWYEGDATRERWCRSSGRQREWMKKQMLNGGSVHQHRTSTTANADLETKLQSIKYEYVNSCPSQKNRKKNITLLLKTNREKWNELFFSTNTLISSANNK